MNLNSVPEAFSSRLRIAIISSLYCGERDFAELKRITGATDGNLSVQLSKLCDFGYTETRRTIQNKKSHTVCRITESGKSTFEEYVNMLKCLSEAAR
ncbi:MAG: transcriptional regulator [Oscillospiraceae bacterium]|nr:transcriptional regulator [Oscillospiraceae bacterium]